MEISKSTNNSPRFRTNPLANKNTNKNYNKVASTGGTKLIDESERKEKQLKEKLFNLQEPNYNKIKQKSPRLIKSSSPRSNNNKRNNQYNNWR